MTLRELGVDTETELVLRVQDMLNTDLLAESAPKFVTIIDDDRRSPPFEVRILPDDTVGQLADRILNQTPLPRAKRQLLCEGRVLHRNATLRSIGFVGQLNFVLSLRGMRADGHEPLQVSNANGGAAGPVSGHNVSVCDEESHKTFQLPAGSQYTAAQLAAQVKIGIQSDIPPWQRQLVHNGRVLPGNTKLSELGFAGQASFPTLGLRRSGGDGNGHLEATFMAHADHVLRTQAYQGSAFPVFTQCLMAAFINADTNGDGLLQPDELRSALIKAELPISDLQVDELVAAADQNQDGRVDYNEFAGT